MKTNRMKARIKAGVPAFGVSIMIPSPQIVEIVGGLGFDWILIDCEHGNISLETAEHLALAAEASGVTPIARPKSNRADDILQLMDRGIQGVQVPHVNTAEDARRAVEAVKYHPMGTRGLGGGTRAAGYGLTQTVDEYVEVTNNETLVCVQLEDAEAIENVDEILEVENIDVFFIGPNDLSQSMGYPGNPKEPVVAEAINSTFEKIRAAGKASGTPGTVDNIQDVLAKGVLYTYNHIPKLLNSATQEFFQKAKP
ncbi:MAG: aldolase/citrate lyase family protein [Candidatus Latescibacteria bacterium]|jgi:4-hydroxy-2-oxoheptanedioate aldolase|nr:aldolase/citrate lyase family protein [Candidatus Latescibacterota bacterium]